MRSVTPPTPEDLRSAAHVVRTQLAVTPLVESEHALLKLECWQPTGSFKVRGALAALAAIEDRAAGVVTASAGNHGLGVAHAATRLGIPAQIVVPATASPAKVEALRRLGVTPVLHGDGYDAAEAHALELAERGATFISAYNDRHVIAGQASVGGELRDEVDGPITVVVPVGGGGLVSGLALWAAEQRDVRVVGVEAAASRAVSAAVSAGRTVPVTVGPTLADGLAGNLEPGSITAAIPADRSVPFVAVSEEEIRHAMRHLATRHGLVTEGAGAVGVAAVLAGKVEANGRVVAVVTGRNIALRTFAEVLSPHVVG